MPKSRKSSTKKAAACRRPKSSSSVPLLTGKFKSATARYGLSVWHAYMAEMRCREQYRGMNPAKMAHLIKPGFAKWKVQHLGSENCCC